MHCYELFGFLSYTIWIQWIYSSENVVKRQEKNYYIVVSFIKTFIFNEMRNSV